LGSTIGIIGRLSRDFDFLEHRPAESNLRVPDQYGHYPVNPPQNGAFIESSRG